MKQYYIFPLVIIFFSCWGQVDKSKLLGNDYRLFQETPAGELAKAVRTNDTALVEKIVKKGGINLNYQEERFGETLLMLTIKNQQYEMCKKLLELGADPNIHDFYNGSSPIIDAAGIYTELRDTAFLKLLLTYGSNPNDEETGNERKGKVGKDTPLLNAAQLSLEKVKVLLEAGADINHKNEKGATALYCSVTQERYDITLFLLENGADYSMPIFKRDLKDRPSGKEIYLQDFLREKILPVESEEYLLKMKIVDFLLAKGIDYKKVPIPDFVVKKAKALYPKNWQDYLEKY